MSKPKFIHLLVNGKARCCGAATKNAAEDMTQVTCERCKALRVKDEAKK